VSLGEESLGEEAGRAIRAIGRASPRKSSRGVGGAGSARTGSLGSPRCLRIGSTIRGSRDSPAGLWQAPAPARERCGSATARAARAGGVEEDRKAKNSGPGLGMECDLSRSATKIWERSPGQKVDGDDRVHFLAPHLGVVSLGLPYGPETELERLRQGCRRSSRHGDQDQQPS